MIALLGLILGSIGAYGTFLVVREHRRTERLRAYERNHPIAAPHETISPIIRWKARSFYQALHFCDEFIDELHNALDQAIARTPDLNHANPAELVDMAVEQLLIAAARISPFSQGKANCVLSIGRANSWRRNSTNSDIEHFRPL